MIVLALWLVASILVTGIAGSVFRSGMTEPSCNQNCRQGWDCQCGLSATTETPP